MKRYDNIKIGMFSILLFIGTVGTVFGQQDPQYTQYMYNHANINPAYTGSLESLNIYGQYRAQWVSLDGAPKTATMSVTSAIGDTGLGIGAHFYNDKLGIMTTNNFALDISYSIDLSADYKMAFGVKGSGNLLDVDYSKLNIYDPSDPVTQENIDNKFTPNIGAGLFLYSEKSYVGISVPNLLTTTRYDDNFVKTMRQKMHFYLTAGYVFDINKSLKLKPAMLIKAVEGAPLQVDISANMLFKEKLTLGVAYRWDASVSALAGFQITKGLFVGYNYDMDTTKLSNYSGGSHEVFMRFQLFNSPHRTNAPRFF